MKSRFRAARPAVVAGVLFALAALTSTPSRAGDVSGTASIERVEELMDDFAVTQAEAMARQLLARVEARHGKDSRETARVLNLLVHSIRQGSTPGRADGDDLARRAIELNTGLYGRKHLETAKSLHNQAGLMMWRGEYDSADELFRETLRLRKDLLGSRDPVVAQTQLAYAGLLLVTDIEEAVRLTGRALRTLEKTLDAGDPRISRALLMLAKLHILRSEFEDAAPLVERALSFPLDSARERAHRGLALILEADLLVHEGTDFPRAVEIQNEGIRLFEEVYEADHGNVGYALYKGSVLAGRVGRYLVAAERAERSYAIRAAAFGLQHPTAVADRIHLVGALRGVDRHSEAQFHLTELRQDVGELAAVNEPQTAFNLDILAERMRQVHLYGEALALWKRALEILEDAYGPEDYRLTRVLADLAFMYHTLGGTDDAIRLLDRNVQIHAKAYDLGHPRYANALRGKAYLLWNLGAFDKAVGFWEGALGILERHYGVNHPGIVPSLRGLSGTYWSLGRTEESLAALKRAMRITEGAFPPDHPQHASLASYIAGFECQSLGQCEGKLAIIERALRVWKRVHGPVTPTVARETGNVARLLWYLGREGEAQPYLDRELEIWTELSGPVSTHVSSLMWRRAWWFWDSGEYTEALESMRHNLRINRQIHGDDHLRAGVSLHGLAALLANYGDFDEAETIFRRSLEIHERWLHPRDPELATVLLHYGFLLRELGRPEDALLHVERAVEIMERATRSSLYELGALTSLAAVQADLGRHEQAIELARRSIEEWTPNRQIQSNVGWSYERMGESLDALGRHPEATPAYERAVERYTAGRGAESPEAARGMALLAQNAWTRNLQDRALATASRSSTLLDRHTDETLSGFPERLALRLVATRKRPEEVLFSGLLYAEGDRSPWLAACWDWELRRRGLVLRALADRRTAALASDSPQILEAWEHLVRKRERLAALWIRGPEDSRVVERRERTSASESRESLLPDLSTAVGFQDRIETARREKEDAEAEFVRLGAGRHVIDAEKITPRTLARALPAEAALVEYVRIAVRRPATVGGRPHDIALILPGRDRPTAFVDLGPSAEIDAAVTRWRRSLARGLLSKEPSLSADLQRSGARLRALVWDPIAARIPAARTIFVVPEGATHQVNLAALPSATGGFLIEDGLDFHVLSAGRDLVRYATAGGGGPSGSGLLALGAPDYEGGSASGPADVVETAVACRALGETRWPALPESGHEATAVAELFRRHDRRATVLVGSEATEERFKRAAPGSRFLHVATHGFFLRDGCVSAPSIGRGIGGLTQVEAPAEAPAGAEVEGQAGFNPLLLSGLVLAGANGSARAADGNDGILTAEELTAMDLRGVEIAALSACDTGLGSIERGEGVFGLRRALEVAGARTVLMSLWPVPDLEAGQWMTRFYEARLEGKPVLDATREAQLGMLTQLRRNGRSAHPYYWAGFVAAGAWR